MWLIVTLLWLPWAGLAVWLARQLSLGRSPNEDADATELARRAYAKGEVTRERFMEMMADLSGGTASGGRNSI
ncbi:MAG: SHOCT domain-containing protein [Dehalococcoidia bacterium]